MTAFRDSVKSAFAQVFGRADIEDVLNDGWDYDKDFPQEKREAMKPKSKPVAATKPMHQRRARKPSPVPRLDPLPDPVDRVASVGEALVQHRHLVCNVPAKRAGVTLGGAPTGFRLYGGNAHGHDKGDALHPGERRLRASFSRTRPRWRSSGRTRCTRCSHRSARTLLSSRRTPQPLVRSSTGRDRQRSERACSPSSTACGAAGYR